MAETAPVASDVTFRADASEVRVSFSTTDENGHVVATIQPTDFAIVDEDRVVRDFRSFTRSEYTRLEVTLLLDASGSTTGRFREELGNVLEIIGGTDGVPEESFSVVSFQDAKPFVICHADCRTRMADPQFPAFKTGGLTPLYDSISFASRMLGRADDPHVRKLLVVFSDGADTISLESFAEALDSAVQNDVAIYSVDVSPKPHMANGSLALRSFSLKTGGRYFTMDAGTDKIVDAMLKDFHATYTVAYKMPDHAAGFHQVRILPTHNVSLQFHCRHGYYFPSTPGN